MQKRGKGKPFFKPRQVQNEHRLNREITAPEVRVIGEDIAGCISHSPGH
jgi:translation initiation factor IF-3